MFVFFLKIIYWIWNMRSYWPGHWILLFSSGNHHVGGGALSTIIVGTSEEGHFPLLSAVCILNLLCARSHACCCSRRSGRRFRMKRNCLCRCIFCRGRFFYVLAFDLFDWSLCLCVCGFFFGFLFWHWFFLTYFYSIWFFFSFVIS